MESKRDESFGLTNEVLTNQLQLVTSNVYSVLYCNSEVWHRLKKYKAVQPFKQFKPKTPTTNWKKINGKNNQRTHQQWSMNVWGNWIRSKQNGMCQLTEKMSTCQKINTLLQNPTIIPEQIKVGTWNLCLGLLHKRDYVKSILLEYKIRHSQAPGNRNKTKSMKTSSQYLETKNTCENVLYLGNVLHINNLFQCF